MLTSHMVEILGFDSLLNKQGHSAAPIICSFFNPHRPAALSFIPDIKPNFSVPEALAFDEWQAIVVLCMLFLLAVVL